MACKTTIGNITMGEGFPLVLIAGPCVIEDEDATLRIASFLKKLGENLGIGIIFKASFDKANWNGTVGLFLCPGNDTQVYLLFFTKFTFFE